MLKTFTQNKCRLCGNIKIKGTNLFSASAKRSGLLSKISKRLSREVHIAAGDDLPKFVCSDCEDVVTKFSEFCAMVQSTQKQLERNRVRLTNGNADSMEVNCDAEFAVEHTSGTGYSFGGSSSCSVPTVIVGPGSQVECTLCGSFLDAAEHTTLHMVSHGIGTVICQCRSCGQQGELPQFLQVGTECSFWCKSCHLPSRHSAAGHADRKVFTCDVCSKTFRTKGHLSRHEVIHSGAKPFLCEVCGCGFNQKVSLKLHVLGHTQLNPHKCSHCGQGFRFKVSLNSHILNVHGGSGVDKVTEHRCDKCGKMFATLYKLRRHYRSHTGDRPYECTLCGKLFSQTGNLNLHRKKHEEEDADSFRTPAAFDTSPIPGSNDLDPKFLTVVLPQQLPDPSQYGTSHFAVSTGEFLVSTDGVDKTKTADVELFTHFSHDGLLFMEDNVGGPGSDSITLPTFSSLQAGALPHH